jgi:hypothetical protein
MIRISSLLIAGLAASCLASFSRPAEAQSAEIGGFAFLQLDPSARSASLAGSYVAVPGDDNNAMFFNPALLNPSMSGQTSISYLNHLTDINAGFLSYARDIESLGTFGAGIRFLSWGSIDATTETGEKTGTFGATDFAVTLGGSRPHGDRLRYGANIHFVYSSIESYSAAALAADLGLAYSMEERDLIVGASLANLGLTLSSFGTTRDKLPLDLRLGVSKRLQHLPLLISLTLHDLDGLGNAPNGSSGFNRFMQFVVLGGEFQFSDAFNLRLGYDHRRHDALKQKTRLDFAGVSVGVGIRVKGVRVDYAYNSWSSLGGMNQFSVSTAI